MAGYFRPYKYIKDESNDPIYGAVSKKFIFRVLATPALFTFLGIFVLVTQIILPLFVFTTKATITKPVEASVLGVASGFREFEFSELSHEVNIQEDPNKPDFYYLTIPKLRINKAKVETTPPDLNPEEALGHYIGSDLPGEAGNTFIYGHSVLPVFYNPENYKTIFSTISKLEIGDEFTIEYNNKKLTYAVEGKIELYPDEVDPLVGFKPKYLNESTVTLMTCSPAGTKIRRLMVNATLVN